MFVDLSLRRGSRPRSRDVPTCPRLEAFCLPTPAPWPRRGSLVATSAEPAPLGPCDGRPSDRPQRALRSPRIHTTESRWALAPLLCRACGEQEVDACCGSGQGNRNPRDLRDIAADVRNLDIRLDVRHFERNGLRARRTPPREPCSRSKWPAADHWSTRRTAPILRAAAHGPAMPALELLGGTELVGDPRRDASRRNTNE